MTDTERERINVICEIAGVSDIEDLSDGFHTFAQLYYQRMILSAVIVKQNKNKSWKSLRHENGELCFGGGWFIVGIDTPEGSYTYHYETKYFDLFDCEIIDYGKHWDGHTEKDVTRLLALPSAQQDVTDTNVGDMINRQAAIDALTKHEIELPIYAPRETDVFWDDAIDCCISEIEALPSAQPDLDEWCTDCKEYDKEKHSCPRFNRVIRETLKDAELEPCEDAVSRKDAIRWVKTECNPYGKPTLDFESGKKVIEYLERMSPVTPKRKPGHWETYIISMLDGEGCRCSECGFDGVPYWDFCPNCGADMRGEDADDIG